MIILNTYDCLPAHWSRSSVCSSTWMTLRFPSMVKNRFQSGLRAGFYGGSPSQVELLIYEEDNAKAQEILSAFKQEMGIWFFDRSFSILQKRNIFAPRIIMASWRNWIAHLITAQKVTGLNPVEVTNERKPSLIWARVFYLESPMQIHLHKGSTNKKAIMRKHDQSFLSQPGAQRITPVIQNCISLLKPKMTIL